MKCVNKTEKLEIFFHNEPNSHVCDLRCLIMKFLSSNDAERAREKSMTSSGCECNEMNNRKRRSYRRSRLTERPSRIELFVDCQMNNETFK